MLNLINNFTIFLEVFCLATVWFGFVVLSCSASRSICFMDCFWFVTHPTQTQTNQYYIIISAAENAIDLMYTERVLDKRRLNCCDWSWLFDLSTGTRKQRRPYQVHNVIQWLFFPSPHRWRNARNATHAHSALKTRKKKSINTSSCTSNLWIFHVSIESTTENYLYLFLVSVYACVRAPYNHQTILLLPVPVLTRTKRFTVSTVSDVIFVTNIGKWINQ